MGLWITGQMLASIALDGFGWLGVEREVPGLAQPAGGAAVVSSPLIVRGGPPFGCYV